MTNEGLEARLVDIIELLKAQEGRLLTLETALAHLLPQKPRTTYQTSDHYFDRMLARSTGEMAQRMAQAVPPALMADIVGDHTGRKR
jgi:hypothetical protein